MDKSWIKLHRKIKENIFLMHDDKAFNVFIKLLLFCNSSGQYANGRVRMAETFEMNASTLYKVLLRLEKEQLISISSNSRYTVFSICKWSYYQASGNSPNVLAVTAGEQLGNSSVTAGEHLSKNKNKNKNKKGPSKIDEELARKEQAAMARAPNTDGVQSAADIVRVKLIKKGILKR
jgi:hypothetical protein